MKNIVVMASFVVTLAGSIGCDSASTGTDTPTDETARESSSTLLASLTLGQGQTVNFYRAQAGFVFASETGKVTNERPKLADLDGKSFVEMYQALAPASEVPQALIDAERQQKELAPPSVAYAPSDTLDYGKGPSFYTSGQQTWFKNTICPGSVKCIQGWDWIDSGWDYTTSWKSYGMVGSEGTVTVPLVGKYWSCSGSSCTWATFISVNLSPGYYNWVSGSGLFYYKGTMTGAGGNTQISMAIFNAPYGCAFCNDSSCQCGYMSSDYLCSGHGGVHPYIGCLQQE